MVRACSWILCDGAPVITSEETPYPSEAIRAAWSDRNFSAPAYSSSLNSWGMSASIGRTGCKKGMTWRREICISRGKGYWERNSIARSASSLCSMGRSKRLILVKPAFITNVEQGRMECDAMRHNCPVHVHVLSPAPAIQSSTGLLFLHPRRQQSPLPPDRSQFAL